MSYFTQNTIAQHTTPDGIVVIIREGLNCKEDLELRLEIPKEQHRFYDDNAHRFIYEKRGPLYFAVDPLTGKVSYYAYERPGTGFGGAKVKLTLTDGTEEILIGPWSSRAECMNMAGFTPSKEVNIQSRWNMASNLTVSRINELICEMGYECVAQPGKSRYSIVKKES